ncbi:MAG: hypothetical protein B6242_11265 [Anaerolineaceae bacterium 4572_78]|nr:MAG: hypothetical protein B6242_11265 [Anaerolineaceae bacterium 4572_78]
MWESVWRAFFNIAPKKSIAEQTDDIRQQLEQINPAFVSRLPLLGAMLNLPLLDNDVTANMETKLRKSSLESLLIDCLRTWAGNYPLLIMLEDVHWIDALSRDLLEGLARSVEGLPVLFLVVYRPPELQKIKPPQIDNLSYFTEIKLDHFTTEEAATLIRIKLEQFSDTKDDISTEFVERITARAQGNPFYIDELLNYLHDQHIDPHDTESIAQLDLPTSLHSLILSRVDQLTETQKLTLKIASVIGRIFETALLWGIYPELGDPEVVKADLNHLRQYELALPESHAQEIAEEMYFFKHIVTQEVAYESIPYATRSTLHEQLAQFMEANFVDVLEQYVNLLAHHYGHTDNHAKKRKYFLKAGEAAQAKYANDAAIDYYHRALPLVSSEKELTIRLNLGDVLISTGQYKAAVENLNIALALADEQNNLEAKAKVCRWVARSYELQGEYPPALSWIERGLETLKEIDTSETAQLMLIAGLIHARQGHFDEACEQAKHALSISQSLNETTVSARSYNLLAYVAGAQSNVPQAIEYAKQSLTLYQQTNNLQGQGLAQNEISRSYIATGQWEKAESYLQQGLNLFEQIGDVYNQIVTNINLGIIVLNRGKLEKSVSANQSALQLLKHSGGTLFLEGVLHNNLAGTYVRCENIDKARYHLQISQNLFEQAQVRDFLPEMTRLFAETDLLANDLKKAETNIREALRLARELGMPEEEGNSLRVLGKIQTQSGASTLALTVKESLDPPQFEQAKQSLTESMTILNEVGNTYEVARSQLVLAELYAIQQNNDESLALLDKCQPVFESLGASLDLKNAKMLRHDMSFV